MYLLKNGLRSLVRFYFVLLLFVGVIVGVAWQAMAAPSIGVVRDTEIEAILHEWSAPIFKAAGLDPAAVNIILVQSDDVNAFVAGGQNIFIYTGLISRTTDPGELIGVIAHETGHIAAGHLVRGREAMERASYESIIGTILGVGVAILSGDSSAAGAISMGGSSMAQRKYLAHSRVQESSADQAALSFLERAKLNPSGLVSFMDKLKSDNYRPQSQQSEYVRTHPLFDTRIEALSHRAHDSSYMHAKYPAKWQEQHARMKAKLLGFVHPEQLQWVYSDRDTSIAARYARAIAAYRTHKVDAALKYIDGLLKAEPKNPYFLELKGQMLVDFGRVREAVPYYKRAVGVMPQATLFRISLAHALIESALSSGQEDRRLNDAVGHLERALREDARSPRVHRLLATAYGRLGQESYARLHLAEEAVLQRRFSYALQHARGVLAHEKEGTVLWLKAKDIVSFVEMKDKE